jgi:hypothetical protein
MVYLIVGVDRRTLAPWHRNVAGHDVPSARRRARTRARAVGVDLLVAAVIGPHSTVLPELAGAAAAEAA